MKRFTQFSIMLITLSFLGACSTTKTRNDKVSAIINGIDNPVLISSFNPQNLIDKSGLNDNVLPYTEGVFAQYLASSEETGIDYSEQVQIVVSKGKGLSPFIYAIFKVKDNEMFKVVVKEELSATVKEKDGYQYFAKDESVVVWNEEFAIHSNISKSMADMFTGSNKKFVDERLNKLISLIELADKGESNETYTDFLNHQADVSIHYDSEGMYKTILGVQSSLNQKSDELKQFKDELVGNSMDIFMNFNNENVNVTFDANYGEILKEKLNFVSEEGIDESFFQYGKSANPVLKYALHFDIDKLNEFVEDMGEENVEYNRAMDELNEEFLEMGLTKDDMIKAFSGDMLFILDQIYVETVIEEYEFMDEPIEFTQTKPVLASIVGVRDQAVIIKAIQSKFPEYTGGLLELDKDAYVAFISEDKLIFSTDSSWVNAAVNGQTESIAQVQDFYSNYPAAFDIDFQNKSFQSAVGEFLPVVDLFSSAYAYANLNGGELNIDMKNTEVNSLRQITEVVSNVVFGEQGDEALVEELEAEVQETESLDFEGAEADY